MKNINSISSFLLVTIILVITAIGACKDYKQKTFNYIEMSTRFKRLPKKNYLMLHRKE